MAVSDLSKRLQGIRPVRNRRTVKMATAALPSRKAVTVRRRLDSLSSKEVYIKRLEASLLEQTLQIEDLKKESTAFRKSIEDLNSIIEGLRHSREKIVQCEKLAALGRFTADVAHEIRNPLTAVGGFARRLLKKLTDGQREKEYAEIIIAEVSRLEKILKDILTFSRHSTPKIEMQKVSAILRESLLYFEEIINDQSIEVVENLLDVPQVLVDRSQIRQVMDNIISNALDSMASGGTLRLSTGMEMQHEIAYVTVKISDSGDGIPQEKIETIFEPFVTTKEIGHGTGLGLPISRKIMEEHSGFIRCTSNVGEGSSFTLFFPYQQPEDASKLQCWDYMECGRECNTDVKCPAYPNYGRVCWAIAGTYCEGMIQGSYAQKIENCKRCYFYKLVNEQE